MSEPRGFTVWFTGLSGSGKSTTARLLTDELRGRGLRAELLSGAEFRQNLSQGLGFGRDDRIANIRRIGYVAKLLARNGVAVVTTSVSPYRAARDEVRARLGDFVEVFVDCPADVCEQRDPKGLWAKARAGLLEDFTGVHEPYEPPAAPEVVCHSDRETPAACVARVLEHLDRAGYLPRDAGEERRIKAALRSVGYS